MKNKLNRLIDLGKCRVAAMGLMLAGCVVNISPLMGQAKIVRDAKTNKTLIQVEPLKPTIEHFDAFVWKSEAPADCPFRQSDDLRQIRFLGIKSGFFNEQKKDTSWPWLADTWYPSWAEDNLLYSPYTDGDVWRLDGTYEYRALLLIRFFIF